MPIRLFDFKCSSCNLIFECLVDCETKELLCEKCDGVAKRIISVGGVYTANETTNWLPSVLEVVDKDSKAPHVVEFRKNPTRKNYKNWMKGEGLRHLEPGEESRPYPKEPDLTKLNKEVWESHRKRNRLEVRSR